MTMDADAVITAYVADVAARLPRRRRGDVAFELQALLAEELQGVAAAEGRAPDAPMALALVRAFGEPAEVADRYRTPLTVIDAADGRRFVVASVVGLVLIWIAGFVSVLRDAPGLDTLSLLGRWWVGTVIPSPWWPGVLVLWFGAAAWGRRRGPRASAWTPRAPDAINGGRAAIALGLVGMLAGIGILLQPARVLDLFWPGTAAPAAVAALTYSAEFVALRGPVLRRWSPPTCPSPSSCSSAAVARRGCAAPKSCCRLRPARRWCGRSPVVRSWPPDSPTAPRRARWRSSCWSSPRARCGSGGAGCAQPPPRPRAPRIICSEQVFNLL